jgi:hypothetical protein
MGKFYFAVRSGCTAMVKKYTAKPLLCVFLKNARQRPHDRFLHGKGPLPCVKMEHGKEITEHGNDIYFLYRAYSIAHDKHF